jgi:hypothetical protein
MSIASSKPVDPPSEIHGMSQQHKESSVRILAGRQGKVDLETPISPLADYLHAHQSWIERCFKPLKVEVLSPESYKLQFFRIGGLGFELEPCFGVRIWAEEGYLFRLSSIELPSDAHLPYKVDCQSYFRLEEQLTNETTRVYWDLKLDIWMALPGFLQALPHPFVHRVGSKVVHRVTRTMSDRLTHNVCSDFYRSIGKPGRKYHLIDTTLCEGLNPQEEKETPVSSSS